MSEYFDFLKNYKNIYENAIYTEEMLDSVDSIYKLGSFENQMRKTLEAIVNKLVSVKLINPDPYLDLSGKINLLYKEDIIDFDSKDNYHTIRKCGNGGSHADKTMDTYSQQRLYKKRRAEAENAYKRLYVECHKFVFTYMADEAGLRNGADSSEPSAYSNNITVSSENTVAQKNNITIENVVETRNNITKASAGTFGRSDNTESTVNFGKFDEKDDYVAPPVKPASTPLLTTMKLVTYAWWVIYAIWRSNDISGYPHLTSTDSLTWLREGGIESFFSDYFDMLFGINVFEFHLIHFGLIISIITAVIIYKNNKNTRDYIGSNLKGVFSLFILPIIIIPLSFSFPYSVSIPEGTTISSTYYDRGYSDDDYKDKEWQKEHAKKVTVKCVRTHGDLATYRATTEAGSFEFDLPKNKYIDLVFPYNRNSELSKYKIDRNCDIGIRCIDNDGTLYELYILMPDSDYFKLYDDGEPDTHHYFDSKSRMQVIASTDTDYGKWYFGANFESSYATSFRDFIRFID